MAITNNHSQEEIPLEQLTALGIPPQGNRLEQDTMMPQQGGAPQQQMAPIAQMPQANPLQQQAVSPLAQPVAPEEQQQQVPPEQQQQEEQAKQGEQQGVDLPQDFQLPYSGEQGGQPLAPMSPEGQGSVGPVAYTDDGVKIDNYNPNVPIDDQKKINKEVVMSDPDLIIKLASNPDLIDEIWDEISG
jgi:hypothetical protein